MYTAYKLSKAGWQFISLTLCFPNFESFHVKVDSLLNFVSCSNNSQLLSPLLQLANGLVASGISFKTLWNNCQYQSVQFSSVTQSWPTICDPMNHSMPGLPVHHHLLELTQTHVHWVHDAIQPSHPLLSPSPPAPNPSQHQGLFQWVKSSHEVAKVLEFQLQHQSFQ